MTRRLALVIGNAQFEDAQSFPALRTPLNDARQFADTLKTHGHFEVVDLLLDQNADKVRLAINRLYSQAQRGDLTLLYYSGHGYKAPNGQLYLAASDTQASLIKATGIWETYLHEAMVDSPSRHRVLVLDCCFSGTFIGDAKAASQPLVFEQLAGEATAILASSGRVQYSFEEQGPTSLFTRHLLAGISSGEADEDQDGLISAEELFNYAAGRVKEQRPEQTPMLELSARDTRIVLAETPAARMAAIQRQRQATALYSQAELALQASNWETARQALEQLLALDPAFRDAPALLGKAKAELDRQRSQVALPSELVQAIASPLARVRLGAVEELERLLQSETPRLVELSRTALLRMVDDDSRLVSSAAQRALAAAPAGLPGKATLAEKQLPERRPLGTLVSPPPSGPILTRPEEQKRVASLLWWKFLPTWAWTIIALAMIIVLVTLGNMIWQNLDSWLNPPQQVTSGPVQPTKTATVPRVPTATVGATTGKDGMSLVFIPAGDFLMGSSNQDDLSQSNEKPQHKVYLKAYWIDKTEVTIGMFRKFVQSTGYVTTAEKINSGKLTPLEADSGRLPGSDWEHPRGPGISVENIDRMPVALVTWDDAQAYCQWAGRRLPSEAEWEKAARGTDGRIFPWGNDRDLNGRLNYWGDADGYPYTAPVGSFPAGASPYGVLDMAGNVWEWVADWYSEDYYSHSSSQDPTGPATGDTRAKHGGSFADVIAEVRSAARHSFWPGNYLDSVGFRCAMDAR